MTTSDDPGRSVTLRLPAARKIVSAIAVVVIGGALLLVGIRIGTALLGPSAVAEVTNDGTLHEIHVQGGAVYLGRIVSDAGGVLRVADPAALRPGQAAGASPAPEGPGLVVQSLVVDPYDLAGEVVIPLGQVTLVGNVVAGSGLEQAYLQALANVSAPPTSPSPSP